MKIALVSEHASPLATIGEVDAGGQNVHVAELARGLAECNADVTVYTRRDRKDLPRRVQFVPGVTVQHVDAGPAQPVAKDELLPYMNDFARELRRSWKRDRPDVVHAHFWMSGSASLEAARPYGIPVVQTFHALGIEKKGQQGARDTSPGARIALEAHLARSVDLTIATSDAEREMLFAMGAASHQVTVIPCGVDLTRFSPEGPVVPRSAAPRVVVVSRLVERKGLGNVIEAMRELPGVELLIAGGPPRRALDGDPEARRLRELVAEQGVAERVRLLGGVEHERVPELIRSADVVACCPWYEPFGLVAIEAMACGIPVVASAVGGLAESVVHGRTGLLVPPRRPDRIAAALTTLLHAPGLRHRMGEAAAQRARRFGWPQIAAETMGSLVSVSKSFVTGADVADRRPA